MLYVLGDYTLDPERYELRQAGALVKLEPRVFDLLSYLVQHPGRTVTKEELYAQVWPDQSIVSDNSLTKCIEQARKAVGDTGQKQRCIQTVRSWGYRFIAPIEVRQRPETDATSPPAAETPMPAQQNGLDEADARSPAAPGQIEQPSASPPRQVTVSGPRSAGHAMLDAERRQLTVLVCRLVGGPARAKPLDPEELFEVARDYHAMCAEVVRQYEGHIVQTQGDRLVVYFGYPRVHEDNARRAVHTGLGLVAGMAEFNRRFRRNGDRRLAVRVGIHTGVVVMSALGRSTPREPLTLGDTPNVAAQVQTLAARDTVVISQATWRLIEGHFVTQALDTHVLKGAAELLAVYRVLHPAQGRLAVAGTTTLTPFVGREHEVGLLRERWQQAADGMGQVVVVSGEAGIGKSRLVQVFTEYLNGEAHTRIECHGSSYYQQSAFYPVIEHLQRLLQLRPDETPVEKLRKLEDALRPYDFVLAEVVPLFAALLSLPLPAYYPPLTLTPQHQKHKTLETLLAWLIKEAERQPVCVIMEDLHWVDPSTLEFLSLLINQVPTTCMLVLLLARPEFCSPWAPHAHLTQLTLSRLTRRQVETMVTQLTGGKALPAKVHQYLVATTDGVPLFVEELTKMVLESGLVTEQEGQYEITGPLPPFAIPATLHDSLMVRLDRLGPAKQVAQLGAVVGREFSYEVLQAVAPLEEVTLQQGLAQLVEAELLYQRGLPPQAQYLFKHALIQETAYHSVLKSTRRRFHQRIIQVLETQFPETRELHPELLAHHALWGEVWEKAVACFRQAGAKALARSANREAMLCFEQALAALQHLPEHRDRTEQAIDLRLDLRNALLPLGEYERIVDHLREAAALAQTMNDHKRLGWVLWCMADYFRWAGDNARALESGQRALALASTSGDLGLQVAANGLLSQVYFLLGHYGRAVDSLRGNMAVHEGESRHEHFTMVGLFSVHERAWLARVLAELGAFAEGIAHGEEAVRLVETLENPHSLSVVYQGIGFLYFRKGDFHKAIPLLERGLEICRAANLTLWFPAIAAPLSASYALSGRLDEAVPLLRQALAQNAARSMTADHWRLMYWLSEVYPLAHRMEDMSDFVQAAVKLSRAHNEPGCQAWALRMLGEIYAHQDPPEVKHAEASYRAARALAAELRMHPLLAHCHLGLGTVYQQMGGPEQARAELSAAIDLYRAMGMVFWLKRVEPILAQLEPLSSSAE